MPRYLHRPDTRRQSALDVELATLHRCALPRLERPHDAFASAWWSRPARSIGGDVIVTWPVDASKLLVCLADAMGHDTPAAVVASAVRAGLLHARRGGMTSPAAVLSLLNHTVAELFERYFVTATVCLLDATGRLTCAQAGHPPLLVRQPDGVVRTVSSPALPLGLDRGEAYAEHTTALPAGSSVVLYSDGVTDAFTSPEADGLEVLSALVAEVGSAGPRRLVRRIRRAVRACGGRGDDCSVLAVRLLA